CALEDIFQIVVVVDVESANGQDLFGAFELTSDEAVFPAGVGLQRQATVGPELPLGAEAMWRLDQSNQQSCANGADRGNLLQQLGGVVFPAFAQQLSPGFLAQS